MGRGKVELKRIENPTNRQVTFSKRRNGLLKKAFELSVLCDVEVAIIVFSPSGKLYQYASHDMDRSIARYRAEIGLPGSADHNPGCRTKVFWKTEMEELKRSAENLERNLRHLAGEDLEMLGVKELKQVERQLKTAVERVRCKKRRVISENINFLKIRRRALQEENTRLQKMAKLLESPEDANPIPETLGACHVNAYSLSGSGLS